MNRRVLQSGPEAKDVWGPRCFISMATRSFQTTNDDLADFLRPAQWKEPGRLEAAKSLPSYIMHISDPSEAAACYYDHLYITTHLAGNNLRVSVTISRKPEALNPERSQKTSLTNREKTNRRLAPIRRPQPWK